MCPGGSPRTDLVRIAALVVVLSWGSSRSLAADRPATNSPSPQEMSRIYGDLLDEHGKLLEAYGDLLSAMKAKQDRSDNTPHDDLRLLVPQLLDWPWKAFQIWLAGGAILLTVIGSLGAFAIYAYVSGKLQGEVEKRLKLNTSVAMVGSYLNVAYVLWELGNELVRDVPPSDPLRQALEREQKAHLGAAISFLREAAERVEQRDDPQPERKLKDTLYVSYSLAHNLAQRGDVLDCEEALTLSREAYDKRRTLSDDDKRECEDTFVFARATYWAKKPRSPLMTTQEQTDALQVLQTLENSRYAQDKANAERLKEYRAQLA